MFSRLISRPVVLTPIAMALVVVAAPWQAAGQSRQQQAAQSQQPSTLELTLPPDRDLLRFRVTTPAEVRVNKEFQVQIEVVNLSESVAFHDVKIGQLADSKIDIGSAHMDEGNLDRTSEQRKDTSSTQHDDNENNNENNDNGEQEENGEDGDRDQDQQGQNNRTLASTSQGSAEGGNYSQIWTIDRIDPGQTRIIQLTATAKDEGDVQSCLAMVSMTPSLCIRTRAIKPELEIVKQGPEQVHLCEPIVYVYSVRNTGTGNIERFTIHDELDEGLQTLDGESELHFDVDGLSSGEVREFSAELASTQAGEFSSRATVKGSDDTEDRSNSVTTRVVEPRMVVAIEGPDTVFVNRPVTYTIRVSNQGEGRADAAGLLLRYPNEKLTLASMGDPRGMIGESSEASGDRNADERLVNQNRPNTDREQRSLLANPGAEQNAAREQTTEPAAGETRELNLGELAPGESKSVRVTFNTHEGGDVRIDVEAMAWCGAGQDAQRVATVTQTQQTELISLPALALSVIDVQDPVRLGEEVTYRIIVRNEGTAADSNVRVNVELPEELEHVESGGASEGTADDQRQVTFEPVQQIVAGQELSWQLRAKANKPGNIALTVRLESEGLGRQVTAEEPTTLFSAQDLDDSQADGTTEGDDGNQKANSDNQQDDGQSGEKKTASENDASQDDNDSNDRNEEDK